MKHTGLLLRWLFRYYRLIKWGLIIGLLFSMLRTISQIIGIGVQQFIIDHVFVNGQYAKLPIALLIFAGAILLIALSNTYGNIIMDKSGFHFYRLLVGDIIRYISKMPMPLFRSQKTSDFVNYIFQDAGATGRTIANIPQTMQQVITILFLGSVVGWLSPLLLLCTIILAIAYIGVGRLFTERLKLAAQDVHYSKLKLTAQFDESISASREIIAFHRIDWENRRFRSLYSRILATQTSETKQQNKHMLASDPLKWIAILLMLGIGGYGAMKGNYTLGWFVVLYQLAIQLFDAIHLLYKTIIDFLTRLVAVERLVNFMSSPQEKEGELPISGPLQELCFENVCFRYENEEKALLFATCHFIFR